MELRTYWAIVWRRKWVIAVTLAATMAVVIVGTLRTTPIYQASTTVRVRVMTGSSASSADYYYADRLINTYTEIATSKPVLEELDKRLGLSTPPLITVEPIASTELIRITVEDPDPSLAALAANALAEILAAQSSELYAGGVRTTSQILADQLAQVEDELRQAQTEYERLVAQTAETPLPAYTPVATDTAEYEGLAALTAEDTQRINELNRTIALKQSLYATLLQQYEAARTTEEIRSNALSIIDPASIPTSPIKPRKVLNIALGSMVGLMGGVGLAFLFENLDTRLHTVEQIERVTALRALGRIPYTRQEPRNIFLSGASPQREAFRHLRTGIYAAARGSPPHTFLVTSAEPGEGKSTIVTNLALALAQAGQRILVVDADLRRPTLHTNFQLSMTIGLTSVVDGKLRLQDAVQDTEVAGLSVLASGPLPPNPAELLGSRRMRALLAEMEPHFDMVLVDAPALLPVTDAAVVASMVDGVLLVVDCTRSTREAVRSACRELAGVGARVVGLVVNRVQSPGHRYYHYYRLPEAALRGDPLTTISGISPVYEKALNALGIVSFAQLAVRDPELLAETIGVPVTAEQIRRDRWVEQAQALVDGRGVAQAEENVR
jgi:non-specific protein-tyrosine kinase